MQITRTCPSFRLLLNEIGHDQFVILAMLTWRELARAVLVPFFVMTLAMPGCIGIVGIGDKEKTEKYTPGTIKASVSPPERIEKDDAGSGREIWTYPRSTDPALRWRGLVVLLVVVPIPLIVPVGHEDVREVVENGYVISRTYR